MALYEESFELLQLSEENSGTLLEIIRDRESLIYKQKLDTLPHFNRFSRRCNRWTHIFMLQHGNLCW